MKRPRLVWTDTPTAAGGEDTAPAPRRDLRPYARLLISAGILVVEHMAIYVLLSAIGGDLLAVPVLLSLGMIKQVRVRMVTTADKLARRVVKDHSPGNEGVR